MKKLTLIALTSLSLAGVAQVSAATWNITNQLDKEICITVNTGFSRIRRHFKPGETRKVTSKACLYSISVKEGKNTSGKSLRGPAPKGRCPEGLANIAKATITQIDSAEFDALKQKGTEAFTSVKGAEDKKAALGEAASKAAGSIIGAISKACSSRDFIIAEVNGQIKVLTK